MVRVVGKEGALGAGRGLGIAAAAWTALNIYMLSSEQILFFFATREM